MGSKIINVVVCPRCENDISNEDGKFPSSCPVCNYDLAGRQGITESGNPSLREPMTITEQMEGGKFSDPQVAEFLASMSGEKSASILQDALLVLQTIAGKKSQTAGIRLLVELGARIGEIARAYDAFILAGGKHFPDVINNKNKQEQQDGDTNYATTAASAKHGGVDKLFGDV